MDFNEYQHKAWGTAKYPDRGNNIYYPTMGIAGEAGELTEKLLNLGITTGKISNNVKKVMRDHDGFIEPDMRDKIADEVGDVLWYIATICTELNLSMEVVAKRNISKLYDRKERNVISGEGDTR